MVWLVPRRVTISVCFCSAVALVVVSCSDEERVGGVAGFGAGGQGGTTSDSGHDETGADDSGSEDGASEAGSDANPDSSEGDGSVGNDAEADVVGDAPIEKDGAITKDAEDDAAPICGVSWDALATPDLLAGGATPAAFAAAYNQEVAAMGRGPLLIVLMGLESGLASQQIAQFGGFAWGSGGAMGEFAGQVFETNYSINDQRQVEVPLTEGVFDLVFEGSSIPVVAVGLSGTLDGDCADMQSTITLLIPTSAGTIELDGQSVSALMGPATDSYAGGSPAWRLELSGLASQVPYDDPND